jgi:hypothetical protein
MTNSILLTNRLRAHFFDPELSPKQIDQKVDVHATKLLELYRDLVPPFKTESFEQINRTWKQIEGRIHELAKLPFKNKGILYVIGKDGHRAALYPHMNEEALDFAFEYILKNPPKDTNPLHPLIMHPKAPKLLLKWIDRSKEFGIVTAILQKRAHQVAKEALGSLKPRPKSV